MGEEGGVVVVVDDDDVDDDDDDDEFEEKCHKCKLDINGVVGVVEEEEFVENNVVRRVL